jgi:FkbH-like protein
MINLHEWSIGELLAKRKRLCRELSQQPSLQGVRIAVLGGSTTNELVYLLELLLLNDGFRPVFMQSEYGRYYEDAVLDPQALMDFRPDIVYVHTSHRNVQNQPPLSCTEETLGTYVDAEAGRWRSIWDSLERNLNCQVIQNNFEMPAHAILGNLDAVAPCGLGRFLTELNLRFAREASSRSKLLIQDVNAMSARLGLRQWFDWTRYFESKLLVTPEAHLEMAHSLTALIKAIYGKARKVLVLDLDNTLWGGIIGDDGVECIKIGRETPIAESYTAFQEYCLAMRNRGVLLAVCSKNNEDTAKSGLEHPSSVLKLDHISCFKANWDPKHENILDIAKSLKLGVDSFVFIDDNPAEREIVEMQIPGIAVPNVGSDVTRYADFIDRNRYFELISLSKEDMDRAAHYSENAQRTATESKFANYGEYLDSLEMVTEIDEFKPVYLERIAQLTNKTNQFNLTTRRYTLADMEAVAQDENVIALYGKLADRFGDNGLISVVMGRLTGTELHMELWLMSCRVLKRDMEVAMLDVLVSRARNKGVRTICGYYFPT